MKIVLGVEAVQPLKIICDEPGFLRTLPLFEWGGGGGQREGICWMKGTVVVVGNEAVGRGEKCIGYSSLKQSRGQVNNKTFT